MTDYRVNLKAIREDRVLAYRTLAKKLLSIRRKKAARKGKGKGKGK